MVVPRSVNVSLSKGVFTRVICRPFVGRHLDCRRSQTEIDDVFKQPALSDRATSSDLDICWGELTDGGVTISKMKGQDEFIYWALSGCLGNNGVTS